METTLTCPKCAGTMEEGFTVDRGNAVFVANWQPGPTKIGHFLGMSTGIVNTNKDQWRPVATYRYTQCDYLEAYAP